MSKQKTIHIKNSINTESADKLYLYLKDNITWEEGVRSYKGFTRLAKSFSPIELDNILFYYFPDIYQSINNAINTHCIRKQKTFVYLNYYTDGTHWCPNHIHKGTTQLIVSLGETRTLKIGNKNYSSANSDIIIFGASSHGVIPENTTKGRIAIAIFLE
jgi:hypothetical protein